MINIQYFATAQDIKNAYGDNVPSNVVCVAGNNDSVLLNTSNNNPHADKEEQDKPTIVNKINNQDIAVDPTKETIILKHSDEYTGLGTVTVKAVTSKIDKNIKSNNIRKGVTVLGVEGSLKEEKPEESFNVQPTTSDQTITPTEGSVFSRGTVRAVTSEIDSNIQPENIKEGVSILGVAGTLSAGGGSDVIIVPDGMKFSNSTFTDIPQLDTSNVTDMRYMFSECNNLTSISQLNTSNVTDMSDMFLHCSSLTSIPDLNTSNVTYMNGMFAGCASLTTIPHLDTSNVTNMSSMFESCNNLTSIPHLDTSKVTDMNNMFSFSMYSPSNLTEIPQLDTSNVTNMHNMFNYCSGLTTIPQLDTSKVTDMSGMFAYCSNLTTIPLLDTSKAVDMSGMFYNCSSLTIVEGIDFSGLTSSPNSLFGWITEMPTLTRFIVNGKLNASISDETSIKALTAIDYDSVKSILAAADRTDNTNAKELAFNRTIADQNGELAALVTSCSTKGWTITGLTLE